ncbi:MAG TPA: glycosyltransferase family 2 protein [Flavobacteriaceae bacterium]|nr:glycosyltransferase family 2 protein [Flavobacteriaceae bacterium]
MIDVSCIIINYNTSDFTIACVNSIIEFHHPSSLSYEIIVVDNDSPLEDFHKLQNALSRNEFVKLIRSKQNTGFGGGNMLGVQHSKPCRYFAFINNDTLQKDESCLLKLKEFMDANAEAAVCSPQMLDENGNFRSTLDHFSSLQREILKRSVLEKLFPKTYLNRKIRYDKPTKVHYVQGSFMFVRAEDFNNIGGFDTNLFLYYEESDLCRRLLMQANKKTYLIPSLEYFHYKGASTKYNIYKKIEQKLSLMYYINKHYGWWAHKTLLIYFCIRYFFTSIVKPRYWKLFAVLLAGAPIHFSLKQKQKIHEDI